MAIINKIREKTGLAVGVIAFGLILFLIGGELLGPNSVLLNRDVNKIGEIAGEKIDYTDFNDRVTNLVAGRNYPNSQMPLFRQQIWEDLVRLKAYGQKVEETGIDLSREEMKEVLVGENISPIIRQNFTNPNTNQFNKEQVLNVFKNEGNMDQNQRAQLAALKNQVFDFRKIEKYQNLFLKTNFVTGPEARQEYLNKNSTASVSYVYVPFLSLSDSSFQVTDEEIRAYISDNEEEYQVDRSRSIKYVVFDVKASARDSVERKEEITQLQQALANASNDSLFALSNSDAPQPFRILRKDEMPRELSAQENLETGKVYGPYRNGNTFTLYKIAGLSDKYAARASNIVISPEDDSEEAKEAARNKAAEILRDIKNGASFAEKASIHNKDRTAQTGGDLGWFTEGQMVPEFNEAVMNASRTGLINNLVESQYGYHIIDVTQTKVKNSYKVAQISKDIYASDETEDKVYREAETFAATSSDLQSFLDNAAKKNLVVKERKLLKQDDNRLADFSNARAVIAWSFRDAEVGSVSSVESMDGKYIVAVVTDKQDEGTATVNTVRDEVKRKIINERKAEKVTEKLSAASGSLEEIASAYGSEAKVYSMNNLKLSANALNNVGSAPEAVGLAFALNDGEKTAPITVDNGVVILQLDTKTMATVPEDLAFQKDQLIQSRQVRFPQLLDATVRATANVKDNRYLYY